MNIGEREAAKRMGLKVQTLRNWRHQRRGPAYLKLGRRVLYREHDLNDYMEKNRVDPEKW